MAEGEGSIGDHKDTAAYVGEVDAIAPVSATSDSDDRPALSDVQKLPKNNNSEEIGSSNPSPRASASSDGGSSQAAAQLPREERKSNMCSNFNTSHNYQATSVPITGPNNYSNAVPRIPVPMPYSHPPMRPFLQTMVPHIPVPGYVYQPQPGPLVTPVYNAPVQSFPPGVDCSFQPFPRADHRAFNPPRPNQQPWDSRGNVQVPQPMGPRPFMRPPFFPASRGSVDGSNFAGSPGTAYYMPPPTPKLKEQIEYYFSDENLEKDHYLLSLMDDQGWVPISKIAEFRRIKKMNIDIPFILDALKSSSKIEVQNEKVRRRDEWPKWIGRQYSVAGWSSLKKASEG